MGGILSSVSPQAAGFFLVCGCSHWAKGTASVDGASDAHTTTEAQASRAADSDLSSMCVLFID